MEDEEAVKVPVTRLRRRLSVEQSDDAKSSSAPNTPTKKRGGRKAAKPELDLIDENGIESSTPKNLTKKSNMKEIETDEKPVTPSRRSTRIRSNTSLVLETTLTTDSPRAKRAARRTSQVGSDNEAPLTPARQTRRTKKDSTNADKVEPQPTTKPAGPIVEIIVEEPETPLQKSQSIAEKGIARNQSPTTLRKSPRLSLKNNKHSDSMEDNEKQDNSKNVTNQKNYDSIKTSENEINTSKDQNNSYKENIATDKEASQNILPFTKDNDVIESNRLSITSTELLKKLNSEPNKTTKNLNKSSSPIKDSQSQHRRHRTKSWTILSSPVENDDKCYSDSESFMKKKHLLKTSNNSKAQNLSTKTENIKDKLNFSTSKKKQSTLDISAIEVESDSAVPPNRKEKLLSPAANHPNNPSFIDLFNKKPANDMQVLMYIEESDSSPEKITTAKQVEDEDQCVPIVQTHFVRQETPLQVEIKENIFNFNQENEEQCAINKSVNKNDSCEPMDVDETIPDDVIVNITVSKTLDISENKTILKEKDKINCSVNEKDVSSKSLNPTNSSQTFDKTANDNKSTLVLSQLKDISNENNESQSPQSVTKKKLPISLNVTQDNEIDKKKLTKIYSTSTPLQQKGLLKHAVQINTSGINPNNSSKIDKSFDNSKLNKSNANMSKSSEQSESDNDSSKEETSFVNDEAEEANDDYESGDSKDEEEEQYEKENEIVVNGETLTSEDEISNDTDYEKDSFIVSSDVEDENLLDGSGDDLTMSDNELKMTAKSKKKYDERKMKEQKMASRQMFESRHKLNLLNKSNKSEKTKVKKNRAILHSSDSEDEDIHVIKKKRMRLDSSEVSTNISLDNNFESKINKSLSKSLINEEKNRSQNEIINTSIQFIDPEHSEKREGDGDKTQINVTHANDPLDDENSLSSCSSDNVHIENYDSILNDLNKSMKTKKDKKGDVSVNLDKKIKKKSVPIIDQLNLTEIKANYLNDNSKKSVSTKLGNQDSDNESSEEEATKEITSKSVIDKSNQSLTKKRSSNKHSVNVSSEDEVTIEKTNKSLNDKSNQSLSKTKSSDKRGESEAYEDEVTITKTNKSLNDKFNQSSSKKRRNKPDGNESYEDKLLGNNVSSGDEVITEKNSEVLNKKSKKNVSNNDSSDNESSASIDLHLLFSEDSNNSEDVQVTDKKSDVSKEDNNFIPLRKSQGKTDILEMSGFKDASQSESAKKKKKKQTKNMDNAGHEKQNIFDDTEVQFFVDTTGTHCSKDVDNFRDTSKSSASKRKKGKSIVNDNADKNSDSDAPMEVSNKSIKEAQELPVIGEFIDSSLAAANKSRNKTPKSDKKKKIISESETILQTDDKEINAKKRNSMKLDAGNDTVSKLNLSGTADDSMNKSVKKTPKSEKKKTKRMSESQREDEQETAESVDIKNASIVAYKSVTETTSHTDCVSLNSSKQEKPKKNEEDLEGSTANKSLTKTSSERKKSKKKTQSYDDTVAFGNTSNTIEETVNSKKRKRKSSLNQNDKKSEVEETLSMNTSKNNLDTSVVSSRNKKRKISQKMDNPENIDQALLTNIKMTVIETQEHEREKQPRQLENQIDYKTDNTGINLSTKKGTKKRKEREDDEGIKMSKILKIDTCNKTKVPRLPSSILNKLDDKPKKENFEFAKRNAISTSNFTVEETKMKKPKPSNYLEESVYLNETEISESKKQKLIKNPKVLPFLPTVSTSISGYTTNFIVNILPKEIKFVAKSSHVNNYKNDYLENKKNKRLGTSELYKRKRNLKMSKF